MHLVSVVSLLAVLAVPVAHGLSVASDPNTAMRMAAGPAAADFEGMTFYHSAADAHAENPDITPMVLYMMDDRVKDGAVCLDGSPAGFYFSAATSPDHANDWEIYFQGGGWCYDERDCAARSNTGLGSSTHWANASVLGGLMSSDPTVNPTFAAFNRVHIPYCDGNSFSGDRTDPVEWNGVKLFFRGRRIMDAVFDTLIQNHGLGKAENVLLTGCSAGGLATYLHTDYVWDKLKQSAPGLKRFKSAPISGFFLLHSTVEDKPVYPTEMQYIFHLSNATGGLNAACIASKDPAHAWQCNFAQDSYADIKAPIMPLNSALDSWQTNCIFTSELPDNFPNQTGNENGVCGAAAGWKDCAGNPEQCNGTQIVTMNGYMTDFQTFMNSTATYSRNGNGAFIHSCHTHCEAQSGAFNQFAVGGTTIQQAVSKWWADDTSTPAKENTYTPCEYHTGPTGPRKCNPTC